LLSFRGQIGTHGNHTTHTRQHNADGKQKENVRTTLDPTSACQIHVERDFPTPMILGQKKDGSDDEEDDEEDPEVDARRVFEELQVHTWRFVERKLRTEEERKKFMEWLFRLADIDHSNTISVEELQRLLYVVGCDGIRPDEFDYSEKKSSTVEKIMEQFDTGSTGFHF
jgi:hypothetical protein